MMNRLLASSSTLAFALAATSASAQQNWPYWYIGLSGGVTYLDDADVGGASTGDLGFDVGGTGTVSLGYQIPSSMQPLSNMRVELAAGYHENSLDGVTIGGTPGVAGGKLRAISYMANAYYDFRNNSQFTPYLGAGLGLAQVRLSEDSGIGNTDDDEDSTLAYQFMAGLSYAPVSLPNTEWGIGYRYFAVDAPEFATAGGTVELDDVASHTAEINARFKF